MDERSLLGASLGGAVLDQQRERVRVVEVERLRLLIDEAQDRLEDSAKRADLLAGRVQDAHDHEHQRSQFRDLREEAIAVEREERARRSRFDAVLREARVRALAERPLYAKNPTLLDVAADDAWAEACFLDIPVEAWPEFCLVLLSGLGLTSHGVKVQRSSSSGWRSPPRSPNDSRSGSPRLNLSSRSRPPSPSRSPMRLR